MQVSHQRPKSAIQTKLESWVPASPQMETMALRLSEAAERRESELNKLVTRNSVHLSGVKKAHNKVNELHNDRITAIKEKHFLKVEKALESIENQQLRCSQNMERKMEKIIQAQEKANQPALDENMFHKKLQEANDRKRATLGEVVLNVSQINKAKQEKRNLMLQDKEAKVALAQEKLAEKLTVASKRKEDSLKARISKAVEENSVVAVRKEQVRKRRDAHVLEIQTKHENKLESATKRKELNEDSLTVAHKAKQEKTNQIFQDKEAKVALAQEKLAEKLTVASKRKEDSLKARISKAVEENSVVAERVEEVRKRRDAHVLEIQTKHESKLESAMKSPNSKKEGQSTTKKIERAKEYREADLSSIKHKLEFRMSAATQRKESTLQARVEKVAEENRVVSQRAQEVQERHVSLVSEIQSKSEEKLEAAIKRKEQVDKETYVERTEVASEKREKVLMQGEKHNEEVQKHKEDLALRMDEAAARRANLLHKKIDHAGSTLKAI